MKQWITDTAPGERFPFFTRANADEVGPDPFSPLGWSLAWLEGTGPGAADGFVSFGVVTEEELAPDHQVFANYGAYFYNPMSLARLMGVRMPGVTVDAIDRAYFGDQPGVPPYEPDPRDEDEACTARLGETMAWVMSTDSFPRMDEGIALSRRVRGERPVLAELTADELVSRARVVARAVREVWHPYCEVTLAAAVGPGAVSAICAALGRPDDAVALFSGIGGVESAGASVAVWDLSRRVRSSPALTAAFDAGPDGVLARLGDDTSDDAVGFLGAFDELLSEFGHRGPDEWDLRSHSWTTRPELVLGMIERVRFQGNEHDPHAVAAVASGERERLTTELAAALEGDPATQAMFVSGVRSGALFFQLREGGKSGVIRLYHEAKLTLMELGVRMVEEGVLDDPQQLFFLLDSELDDFLAEPKAFVDTIRERERDFAVLQHLVPPYIVDSRVGPPPIDEWPQRHAGAARPGKSGDVLRGASGAPGKATGRARIAIDPATTDLEAGEVLVCATTDPSWAPLFLATSAVVCNVGAIGSHAAIVAREMGVPCAVSVVDATLRIPEGAQVMVDGTNGEVTILSV